MTLSLQRVVSISCAAIALIFCANVASAMSESVLHSFCGPKTICSASKGSGPQALIRDSAGNFYGVAGSEGAYGAGVIYKYSSSSLPPYNALYNYCINNGGGNQCPDGDGPIGSLIMDGSGNLYGVTSQGGPLTYPGDGTIYKISPSAPTPVPIHLWEFCYSDPSCPEGYTPNAGLTYAGAASGTPYDGSSSLYGTTRNGGANGVGTVFALTPGGAATVIANFCSSSTCVPTCSLGSNCLLGKMPNAIIADGNGNLYGTTQFGPDTNPNSAILYKLTLTGNSYTASILHTFCSAQNCGDGQQPKGPLTLGSSAEILGTTMSGGGYGHGEIFEYPSAFFVIYSFCSAQNCTDGANPAGGVIVDAHDNTYGTASAGGLYNYGVVFDLGTTYQVLYNFCPPPYVNSQCGKNDGVNNDGADPLVRVILDGSGDIFGTTEHGGNYGEFSFGGGTLFELTP